MNKMEKTFFIIKPEAFSERDRIKSFIMSHSGLKVLESKIMILTDVDIKALYIDDIGTDLQNAARCHLVGNNVEAGIIEGEDAIDKFIGLCGRYPDGNLCEENTIRKIFGKKNIVKYGGTTYFLNAIHKSSQKEAAASVRWYYDKIKDF